MTFRNRYSPLPKQGCGSENDAGGANRKARPGGNVMRSHSVTSRDPAAVMRDNRERGKLPADPVRRPDGFSTAAL